MAHETTIPSVVVWRVKAYSGDTEESRAKPDYTGESWAISGDTGYVVCASAAH